MAQQIIVNTPADSGAGDSLKVAGDKINANYTELYSITADLQTNAARRDIDNNFAGHVLTNFRNDVAVGTVTANAYTPPVADAGTIRELTNSANIAVALPGTYAKGYGITLVQMDAAGPIVWTAGSGATVSLAYGATGHTKSAGVRAHVSFYVRSNTTGSNAEWVVMGHTAA